MARTAEPAASGKGRAPAGKPAAGKPAKRKAKPPSKRPSPKRTAAKASTKVRKRAEKAAAKARAAGAVGSAGNGRLTKHQKALRDTAIMARSAEGRTAKTIAEEWGISERAVEDVKREWREAPRSLDREPMEIVGWLADMHLRQFSDLTAMAAQSFGSNPSVALGAKKGAGDALLRYMELMSAVGKLPENLELFRAQSVLERLADRMVETMELLQAGDVTVADAVEVFRSITESPGEQPALRAG